jgi:hypothetical protein
MSNENTKKAVREMAWELPEESDLCDIEAQMEIPDMDFKFNNVAVSDPCPRCGDPNDAGMGFCLMVDDVPLCYPCMEKHLKMPIAKQEPVNDMPF